MVDFRRAWIIVALLSWGELASMQGFDIQAILNQICEADSSKAGCNSGGVSRPPTSPVPGVPPPVPGVLPPVPGTPPPVIDSGEQCPQNQKRCPLLSHMCIPNEIDCSFLGLDIKCQIPRGYGVETRALICGDGSVGHRCGDNVYAPMLTVIMVQCQGTNEVDPRPVSSFAEMNGPDDDEGGAGVYRCNPQREWEALYNSPFLGQLTKSCRHVGCGRVPQPSRSMSIHRRWAWVRGIYKDNRFHCTATIVSPYAVVTAAHCLTSSRVSNTVEDVTKFSIELPGPVENQKMIAIIPDDIYIHPRYNYNDRNPRYDMAVMFFTYRSTKQLPIACLADTPHRPNTPGHQTVFSLKNEGQLPRKVPEWNFVKASWDPTCLAVDTRFGSVCEDQLNVQRSQFCATHHGMMMTGGSSGGPYLAEIGEGVEEVWVIIGVLSAFSNVSSCSRDHSIYGQVADDIKWAKECVFDKSRCK